MDVIVTPGAADANSYASIEEADAYLGARDGFDVTAWNELTAAQKALRLVFGACVVDSLKFRGRKVCKNQALQFPRVVEGTKLYEAGTPFADMESAREFADLFGEDVPEIPDNVKKAQIEAAFQVVHSHLFNIEAFESGESSIASLSIDVIHMTFQKEAESAYNLFSKADFGAASTIKLLLQTYLSSLRGELV